MQTAPAPADDTKHVDVVLLTTPVKLLADVGHSAKMMMSVGAFPPLGLAYVAGTLEARGFTCEIIDLACDHLTVEQLTLRLQALNPKVVGVSCVTLLLQSASHLLPVCRAALPNATLVLGGLCMECYPVDVLERFVEVDVGVIGEGELTMADVVARVMEGKSPHDVPGTAFRDGSGVHRAPDRPMLAELDELGTPAYHLLDFSHYAPVLARRGHYATVYASRGCPFDCRHCQRQQWHSYVRFHSPERVVREMAYLVQEKGTREIRFYDETFTINRRWVMEICRLIKEHGVEVAWEMRTRPELLDEELLVTLKEAGCDRICMGVEAGSQERLDRMGRKMSMEDIRTAFRLTHKQGISTLAYFMIGYPGDRRRDCEDSVRFALTLKPTWIVPAVTVAYPGTAIYQQLLDSGQLETDVWRAFSRGEIQDINPDDLTFDGLDYGREELSRMSARFYWRCFMRPAAIWRILRQIGSSEQFFKLVRLAWIMTRNMTTTALRRSRPATPPARAG